MARRVIISTRIFGNSGFGWIHLVRVGCTFWIPEHGPKEKGDNCCEQKPRGNVRWAPRVREMLFPETRDASGEERPRVTCTESQVCFFNPRNSGERERERERLGYLVIYR